MAGFFRRLFAPLGGDLGGAWRELRTMLALRWRLADLEGRVAAAQIKRVAIVLAIAAVLGVVGLPLLAVAAAFQLERWLGADPVVLLTVAGAVLVVVAAALGLAAWRRFRREFVGLEDTLAELREDADWLGEHLPQRPRGDDVG